MGNREARTQAEIVAWVRSACRDVIVYAVLNDGLYTKAEAAKRKWVGLLPGVPDLAIVHPDGAAFLEVKQPGGKVTPEQVGIMEALESLGARCAVVCSLDEAKTTLAAWGISQQSKSEAA